MSDCMMHFKCKNCDMIDIVLKEKAKEWVCPYCKPCYDYMENTFRIKIEISNGKMVPKQKELH